MMEFGARGGQGIGWTEIIFPLKISYACKYYQMKNKALSLY